MIKWAFIITIGLLSSGCTSVLEAQNNRYEFDMPAQRLKPEVIEKIIEKPIPKPVLGQLKPIETTEKSSKKKNMGQLLDNENEKSRHRPEESRFFNAITIYDYMPGALYQVYASPGHLTTIMLQPGETVSKNIMSGDSVTWKAKVGASGQGEQQRQVIYLKPLLSKRKTSMVIPTNKRIYHLELTSFINSYMASVEWNYHDDIELPAHDMPSYTDDSRVDIDPKDLNFNYKIKKRRGKPSWSPLTVFDDGKKTYIKFPGNIQSEQVPALFLMTKENKSQLVNYRYRDGTIVVDRIFNQAELRLGNKRPEVVRISRGGI